MKPVIVYVDDQPANLVVFESELEDTWDVRTYTNPLEALKELTTLNPVIIVSDQRMPGMTGVEYLELAKKILPSAIRMVVTGYSDEQLIIDSVRRAQVFDYIRKPWKENELQFCVDRALDFYRSELANKELQMQLIEKNTELTRLTQELGCSIELEKHRRKELESWVHPIALKLCEDPTLSFPMTQDLVGITFDVIDGAKFHNIEVNGLPVLKVVIEEFSKILLKFGGYREALPGDSVYGHFGLGGKAADYCNHALSAAQEFRVYLRSLSQVQGVELECGIALHYMKDCKVHLHSAEVTHVESGLKVLQKSVGTSGIEVDLLHRMEKDVHGLQGSNIVMSEAFRIGLTNPPVNLVSIGKRKYKGQDFHCEMFMMRSDRVTMEEICAFFQDMADVFGASDPEGQAA